MRSSATIALLCALMPVSLHAQESVCLKTGFCLEAASHMISEGMLVMQSGKGTLQFPVEEVDAITALPVVARAALEGLKPAATVSAVDLLIRAALQQGLEPEFVKSVALIESGLQQEVISPKGAIGLMQLMPRTADQLGVDPTRSDENARGGAAFLRQLLIKYDGNSALALAAYNAGPGAVDRYKGIPPFPETRRYIVKVLQEYARQQRSQPLEADKTAASATNPASSEALSAGIAKPNSGRSAIRP